MYIIENRMRHFISPLLEIALFITQKGKSKYCSILVIYQNQNLNLPLATSSSLDVNMQKKKRCKFWQKVGVA